MAYTRTEGEGVEEGEVVDAVVDAVEAVEEVDAVEAVEEVEEVEEVEAALVLVAVVLDSVAFGIMITFSVLLTEVVFPLCLQSATWCRLLMSR